MKPGDNASPQRLPKIDRQVNRRCRRILNRHKNHIACTKILFLRWLLDFFLDGVPLIFSTVPAFSAFQAGSAVKFDAGAFGAEPDHRAF